MVEDMNSLKSKPVGVIDHDHNSGQVRGILCVNCNTAMGKFGDSTIILQRAIDYLNGTYRQAT